MHVQHLTLRTPRRPAAGPGRQGGGAEGPSFAPATPHTGALTPSTPPPLLQALAAEVVALEEQVLRLKSSHLRDRSEASGATEVARAMQVGACCSHEVSL